MWNLGDKESGRKQPYEKEDQSQTQGTGLPCGGVGLALDASERRGILDPMGDARGGS